MTEASDPPGSGMARAVKAGAARFVQELGGSQTGEGPRIALTFDDGPSAATPQLLEALNDTPATFFLVGDLIDDQPAAVAALVARGQSVGIHGWSHTSFIDLADDELRDELTTTADVVERLTGARPRLVRPPYGHFDERTAAIVRELGLVPVLWSIDPRDWSEPGADAIVDHVLRAAVDGGIALFHDRPGRPDTLDAVSRLVTALPAAGYELVAL
jgi:peptidoglycan/xylan/chitin deacetylase (PgdA/CDA1 family)